MRPLLFLSLVSLVPAAARAQGADAVAEAGRLFQQRCQSCHQAPDPNFATDRAWLDQVNRTA